MKNVSHTLCAIVLLLISFHVAAASAEAACNWSLGGSGAITGVTCGMDGSSLEAYDYSAGTDDADNGSILTVNPGATITLNAGTDAGHKTTLIVGQLGMPDTPGVGGTGVIVASNNYVTILTHTKCYVTDADSDGYSPTPTTCFYDPGAGTIRKNKLTATTVDCGDGNANANPGAVTYRSTTFVNGVNPTLTHDWNCNGTETKNYPTANYSGCNACTNSSGYASYRNTANGFSGSVPACGAAATYYTIIITTACQNPAVANCTAVRSTSSVTQTCL